SGCGRTRYGRRDETRPIISASRPSENAFAGRLLNINPSDLARIDAIVGRKALSKFVRDAIRQQLDRIAPGEEQAGPPLIGVEG
ncbi:hypothetical protein, partial [Rhizobium sp. Leaf391]|uniref:hypothetical protein n=1 Tax=Rhizobium sp. Leaf391 TaxID=1736360 RepID=UPI001AECAAD8